MQADSSSSNVAIFWAAKSSSMVPPLPEMPQPNVSVAQSTPNVMQSGLTPVETALLSEEEKMIALKNRGLV